MMYDCTPPPEKPVPAIIRHIHNVLHPHHRKSYVAARPLMCGDPDMVEIVVETAPYPPDPPFVGYAFDPCCVWWPGADGRYVADMWPIKSEGPEHGPVLRPVSVPEPGPWALWFLGGAMLSAMIIWSRR